MKLIIELKKLEPCLACDNDEFRFGRSIRYRNIANIDNVYESVHCKKCSRIHPVMNRLIALKITSVNKSSEQHVGYVAVDGDSEITIELFNEIFPNIKFDKIECLDDFYTVVGINRYGHAEEYILRPQI